jgi:hypothetical protein
VIYRDRDVALLVLPMPLMLVDYGPFGDWAMLVVLSWLMCSGVVRLRQTRRRARGVSI